MDRVDSGKSLGLGGTWGLLEQPDGDNWPKPMNRRQFCRPSSEQIKDFDSKLCKIIITFQPFPNGLESNEYTTF